jgi:hypothetical protein
MNTNETVRRIDELIGMGQRIESGKATCDSGRMKEFCHGIGALVEEIHGFGNQLSARFGASEGYDQELVKEGITALGELRNLVLYAGEYGC